MAPTTPTQKRWSLHGQLAALILALVTPLLMLQVLWSVLDFRGARKSAEENALAVADAVALGVVQFLSQADELLTATASRSGDELLSTDRCSAEVGTTVALYPFLSNAYAVSAQGDVVCSARPAPDEITVRDRSWFDALREDLAFTIGSPRQSDVTSEWGLPLAAPLTNESGEFAGALVGTVALVELSRLIGGVSVPADHLVSVSNEDRVIIARSAEAEKFVGTAIPPTSELGGFDRVVAPGRQVALGLDMNNVRRTWGQLTIPSGWVVYVGVPYANVLGPARRAVFYNVLTSLVIVLTGLVFAFLSYTRLSSSLLQLAQQTSAAASGGTVDIPPGMPEEVSEVIAKFNEALVARNRAQDAERSARDRLASLFENPVVGLCVSTRDGRFLRVNQALVDMLGYSTMQELIDVDPRRLYVDSSIRETSFDSALQSGRVPVTQLTWRRADGTPVFVRLGGRVIETQSEDPLFELVVQDISEEVRTEDQLRRQQKLDAVGQLAGGIAHHFNNLLMVISGNVERLRGPNASPQVIEDGLEQIGNAADRGAGMTWRLLTFSQQDDRGLRTASPNAVIQDLSAMFTPLLEDGVALEVGLAADLPDITINPGDLEQVVLDLLLNARDAVSGEGTIRITSGSSLVVGADADARSSSIWIRVQDDGVGMDDATRARIFEPFFTTKPIGKGTGLGLSTVFGVIERAGGSIDVESSVGLGTTITVRFPAA
jgi:PAS domain S-box-containing protein